jgi:hypothetical protein
MWYNLGLQTRNDMKHNTKELCMMMLENELEVYRSNVRRGCYNAITLPAAEARVQELEEALEDLENMV